MVKMVYEKMFDMCAKSPVPCGPEDIKPLAVRILAPAIVEIAKRQSHIN